jgi:malate permease and related proteins
VSALLLLAACLALGALVARHAHPPLGLAQGLNWWVINIALPALILHLIPQLHFEWQFWFLVVSQWLVFAGAFVLFRFVGGRLGWSRRRIGGLTLVCGLGNTSFMGYPLLEALRGHEGLALGVIADQIGCFVALGIGGTLVAALYSGAEPHPREILRRIVLFPAFLALLAGSGVGMLGGDQALPLALGLGWKLVVAPLSVLALGALAGVGGLTLTIGVMQAAMAPMISAAILADQHGLDPPLANNVLGAGILLSMVSVPLWSALLG